MNRTESAGEMAMDLLQLARTMWKKIWLIGLAGLILGASAFGYTKLFMTPVYKAQTTLYVNNKNASEKQQLSISQSDLSASQNLVATYTVFLQSRSTLDEVILRAKLPYDYETLRKMVTAEGLQNTGAFHIVVTGTNPDEAALIANTIGDVLPDKIADFIPGSSVKIVDFAIAPSVPFAPSAARNTVMGFILGVLISSAVIVVKQITDNQIYDSDYLTQRYDIPVLAVIPDLVDSQNHGRSFDDSSNAAHKRTKGGKHYDKK